MTVVRRRLARKPHESLDDDMAELAAWDSFYLIVGSAAGADWIAVRGYDARRAGADARPSWGCGGAHYLVPRVT